MIQAVIIQESVHLSQQITVQVRQKQANRLAEAMGESGEVMLFMQDSKSQVAQTRGKCICKPDSEHISEYHDCRDIPYGSD